MVFPLSSALFFLSQPLSQIPLGFYTNNPFSKKPPLVPNVDQFTAFSTFLPLCIFLHTLIITVTKCAIICLLSCLLEGKGREGQTETVPSLSLDT